MRVCGQQPSLLFLQCGVTSACVVLWGSRRHVEPSYVIRKFLDAQRINNLTLYLEALHERHYAGPDHTTLLLNCYTKLKEVCLRTGTHTCTRTLTLAVVNERVPALPRTRVCGPAPFRTRSCDGSSEGRGKRRSRWRCPRAPPRRPPGQVRPVPLTLRGPLPSCRACVCVSQTRVRMCVRACLCFCRVFVCVVCLLVPLPSWSLPGRSRRTCAVACDAPTHASACFPRVPRQRRRWLGPWGSVMTLIPYLQRWQACRGDRAQPREQSQAQVRGFPRCSTSLALPSPACTPRTPYPQAGRTAPEPGAWCALGGRKGLLFFVQCVHPLLLWKSATC
jgi:hypothetical protein